MKSIQQKREEAKVRQASYDKLSIKDKLTHTTEGTKQYKKLMAQLDSEKKDKKKAKKEKAEV